MENFKQLSIRGQQAFAALCFAKFCAENRISHAFVTELIEHLLSILIADNLPDWEGQGARLQLTGRGDPIPQPVEETVPERLRPAFCYLVDAAVEVGMADMYGASTEEPYRFVCQCVNLLKEHGVEPPLLDEYLPSGAVDQHETDRWGAPVTDVEYESVMRACRNSSLLN